MEYELIVLGGGASGLMAACCAGRQMAARGVQPLVVEGNPKLGKKLLATGNGRCNLTNLHIAPERYHGDPLAEKVLEQYPARRVLEAFEELGLLCRADEEGRVYPNGNQAAAVFQLLAAECGPAVLETEILSAARTRDGFLLEGPGGRQLACKKLILACGGMASPAHSLGASGYDLVRQLGHTVTKLSPSLAPLKTSSKAPKALKGMRTKAKASLYKKDRLVCAETGEVIFGEGQLSGICIFNLCARLRQIGLQDTEVGLDLSEGLDLETYGKTLQRNHPGRRAETLFDGVLNLRVGRELVKLAGLDREKPLSALSRQELERAAALAGDWRFPLTGTGSWQEAQVTAGGVPLEEIRLETMGSKRCPGLYLTGELLDVDGDCGGYNLHWAWATGMIAGDAAGKAGKVC